MTFVLPACLLLAAAPPASAPSSASRPTLSAVEGPASRPALSAVQGPASRPALSAVQGHKTDWLARAKWGVMIHMLGDRKPAPWNKVIAGFDAAGLARQLHDLHAGYLMLASLQTGYPVAPNAAYEKRFPGQCPQRDLIADLARELAQYDIPLLLYYNSNIKWEPSPDGVAFSAAVLREFSLRYGRQVRGWWFDNSRADVPPATLLAWQKQIADAARSGNPEALLAFSPPHGAQRNSPFDDYTSGNLHKLDKVVCPGRFVDGAQWHTLCYLGTTWGSRKPRYPSTEAALITARLVSSGGVVTWDTPHDLTGLLTPEILPQLRAISHAARTLPTSSATAPAKQSPAGNP